MGAASRSARRTSLRADAAADTATASFADPLPDDGARLASLLCQWFAGAARDLPWRKEKTPYRVWLSEVMLQQTRVAVVVDYFTRFVTRFPDVASLAAAEEDEVLGLWSGLGYYSRGRNLHKAARSVVDDHGGKFPSTSEGLRALPGVGSYTSAAIASLAFGEATAVVDGNVHRVLMRLCADDTPIDSPTGAARTTARATTLVRSTSSPAVVNEAMMELGALVCTPRSPDCGRCPWRNACRAHARGRPQDFPVKAKKTARRALRIASVVLVDDAGRVWLERRESRGLFGGLWQPPSVLFPDQSAAVDDQGQARILHELWSSLVQERALSTPTSWPAPVIVTRALTHRDLHFDIAVFRVHEGAHGRPIDAAVGAHGTLAMPALENANDPAAIHVDDRESRPTDRAASRRGRFFAHDEFGLVGVSTAVRAVLQAAEATRRAPLLPWSDRASADPSSSS